MTTQAQISPLIVGVLNITPDSFSDGGSYLTPAAAIEHALELREDGADFIEIGGESTRPASKPVPFEVEWKRIEPVIKKLAVELPLAVDTYKAEVAKRALDLGAQLINDVSGLRADAEMAAVIAQHRAKVVIMYSKESAVRPHATDTEISFKDILAEASTFLNEQVRYAMAQGIRQTDIILDPGSGKFISSNSDTSWEVARRIGELKRLGYPLMIGVSRKGFLSTIREGASVESRDPVSALVAVHASLSGVSYIRTHNPRLTKEFFTAWGKLRPLS